MTPRNPAVEHAAELVTATLAEDSALVVEVLKGLTHEETGYTAAACAGLVKTMVDRLAHIEGVEPLELWQRLSQEAVRRYLESDSP